MCSSDLTLITKTCLIRTACIVLPKSFWLDTGVEEIATLRQLEASAQALRQSGRDRKWEELALLLQDNTAMFGESGQREKLIIFTEHKNTLRYLAGKIRSLLGSEDAVLTIHGGMPRDERRKAEERFRFRISPLYWYSSVSPHQSIRP